jgi:hypothetical protein
VTAPILKKSFGVVHAIAECEDCDWTAFGYKNAQAIAAKHAKVHGHRVHVEVGMDGTYDGRASE